MTMLVVNYTPKREVIAYSLASAPFTNRTISM